MSITPADLTLILLLISILFACAAVYKLQQNYLNFVSAIFGRKGLLIVSFFFVPIHELSHYLMAKLFGHKVTEVGFFAPNNTGTLGYVNHAYRRTLFSPFANMLIGIAPLFGFALIMFLVWKTVPFIQSFHFPVLSDHQLTLWGQYTFTHPMTFSLATIDMNADNEAFFAMCFFVLNLLMYSIPSKADFNGAASGIAVTLTLFVCALLFDFLSEEMLDSITQAFSIVLMVIITVITYQFLILMLLAVIKSLKSRYSKSGTVSV